MMTLSDDMRTIIELPQEQVDALGTICRDKGLSRAEAIRRAVAAFIDAERGASSDEAFGLWGDRAFSAVGFERGLRAEWDERVR